MIIINSNPQGGAVGGTTLGTWDASQAPPFENDTPNVGAKYLVTVAGSYDFGQGSISYEVGDYAIFDGTNWAKQDHTPTMSETANDSTEPGTTGADALDAHGVRLVSLEGASASVPADKRTIVAEAGNNHVGAGLTTTMVTKAWNGNFDVTALNFGTAYGEDAVGSIFNSGVVSGTDAVVGFSFAAETLSGDYFFTSNLSGISNPEADAESFTEMSSITTAVGTEYIYKLTSTANVSNVGIRNAGDLTTFYVRIWAGDPSLPSLSVEDTIIADIAADDSTVLHIGNASVAGLTDNLLSDASSWNVALTNIVDESDNITVNDGAGTKVDRGTGGVHLVELATPSTLPAGDYYVTTAQNAFDVDNPYVAETGVSNKIYAVLQAGTVTIEGVVEYIWKFTIPAGYDAFNRVAAYHFGLNPGFLRFWNGDPLLNIKQKVSSVIVEDVATNTLKQANVKSDKITLEDIPAIAAPTKAQFVDTIWSAATSWNVAGFVAVTSQGTFYRDQAGSRVDASPARYIELEKNPIGNVVIATATRLYFTLTLSSISNIPRLTNAATLDSILSTSTGETVVVNGITEYVWYFDAPAGYALGRLIIDNGPADLPYHARFWSGNPVSHQKVKDSIITDIANSKTKTDLITITQPVDLDAMENATNIPSDDVTLEDVDAVVGNSAVADLTTDMVSDASTWNHAVTLPTPSEGSYANDAVGSIIQSPLTTIDIQNISTAQAFPSGDFYMTSNRNDLSQIYLADGDVDIIHGSLETSLDVGGNTEYIYKFTSVGMAELAFIYAQVPSGTFYLRLWAGLPVASSEAQQKIKDSVMSNILAELSTGWVTKPTLTANATTFDHSAGLLRHVDTATVPPTVTEVVVNAASNIVPSNIANSSTFISFGLGGINQTADQLTPAQRRDYAEVGLVSHIDHVNVDAILNEQTETNSVAQQLGDLIRSIGFFSVSGNQIIGKGGTMTLQKTAGIGFALNINSAVDAKDPHRAIMADADPAVMFHLLRDGNLTTNGVTATIDPDVWDNAGAEEAVTNNKFTMPRVYIFPNNSVLFILGQEEFDNLADAKEAAGSETFVLPPDVASGGLLLARIVLKQGVTDITNTAQAFILPASSIAGGGATQTPMQGGYDISTQPQIVTNATLGAIDFQSGTGNDADEIQRWKNNAGTEVAAVDGNGNITTSGNVDGRDISVDGSTLDTHTAEIAAIESGLKVKEAVQTSTFGLGNITLSGEQTLNGLLTSASRILVTDQTLKSENGIYVTDASTWTRATDYDTDAEVNNGDLIYVLNSGSDKYLYKYIQVESEPHDIGTDDLTFEEHANIEDDVVHSNPTGVTGADQITNMISLTQAEYDAIGTPDATTVYVIVG